VSYRVRFDISLGAGKTGLTLKGRVYNDASPPVQVGSGYITTGFSEIGNGDYRWDYASFADGFVGEVRVYDATDAYRGSASVSPADAIPADVPATADGVADAVWTHPDRDVLSLGGTAVAPANFKADVKDAMTEHGYTSARGPKLDFLDAAVTSVVAPSTGAITTAVWAAATRSLTDKAGFAPTTTAIRAELATELARLDAAVSTRSTFSGGAVASVTAPVTVGTNNDKTGYTASVTGTVVLAAGQPNFTPAKAGDAMTLTSAYAGALALTGMVEADAFTEAAMANAPTGGGSGDSVWSIGQRNQVLDDAAAAKVAAQGIAAGTSQVTVGTNNDKDGYDVATFDGTPVGPANFKSDVKDALTEHGYTAARGANLDFLDVAVSSVSAGGEAAWDSDKVAQVLADSAAAKAAAESSDGKWTTPRLAKVDSIGGAVVLASNGLDPVMVEAGINARQALAPILAAAAGTLSGAGTGTVVIRGGNSSATRISATTDSSGNRSAVTLSLPT